MRHYITLFSGPDNKSHFREETASIATEEPLGSYSKTFLVAEMRFRSFKAGNVFDWHTAPQPQFIIYQDGEVLVEAGYGEKRIFKAGDVLFANDLNGQGHRTTTLTNGHSIIITAREKNPASDELSLAAKL